MRFAVGLAILAIGLAILVINHDSGQSFGVNNEDFGRMVVALPILLMISAGIVLGKRSLGQSLRQMAVWVLIALALGNERFSPLRVLGIVLGVTAMVLIAVPEAMKWVHVHQPPMTVPRHTAAPSRRSPRAMSVLRESLMP